MKSFITLWIAFIPGLLVRAQQTVHIKAVIKGLAPGQWVHIQPYSIGGSEDSVLTEAGGFRYTVSHSPAEDGPYLFWLTKKGRYEDTHKLLFLDTGDVHLEGEGPLFNGLRVSGARSATDYEAYSGFVSQNMLATYQDSMLTALTARWILQHPSSPISTYLLLWNTNSFKGFAEKDAIFNQIPSEAKDNIPARKLAGIIASDKLIAVGGMAPDFTQPDTLGHPVSLTDFKGKYVLVDFWASWCVPCRNENPNVVAAYKQYKDRNFTVLSVSLEKPGDKDVWLKAIHDDHLTWTNVSDLKYGYNAAVVAYGITGIPFNLLVDPQGRIVARNLRGDDLDKKLGELLRQTK